MLQNYRRHTPFTVLLLLLAGCAGALFQRTSVSSTQAPPDAYTCVRAQARTLGYSERAHDDTDHRVVAERNDDQARRPDTQFRRLFDRLIVEIGPSPDGTTAMIVEAHTVAEYVTHQGQTFEEEKASERVRQDAATLVAQCSQ